MQFESIANFGAVIDRLGEFQEVLESSAASRPADTSTSEAAPDSTSQPSLIQLVDQPGIQSTQDMTSLQDLSASVLPSRFTEAH